MKKKNFVKGLLAFTMLAAIASCKKNEDKNMNQPEQKQSVMEDMVSEKGTNPDEAVIKESTLSLSALGKQGNDDGHYLYTESNGSKKNEILIYKIKDNGTLHPEGSTASGGNGTGMGLGSQGALAIDKDHEWLYAVNAGCNSVSSFKIHHNGKLTLEHSAATGGTMPVSVTVHDNLLYVLNRGSDDIHGFKIGAGGMLTPIMGSHQALSGKAVDAPQISFTPNGDWIVVTEKATNTISTFKVKNNGSVAHGIFTASVGPTPFGFDFSRGHFMVVTNAAGGAAGAGSATSYVVVNNGKPKDMNGAVANGQGAPCWMAITKFGRFAYASNTGSNNISSYYVAPWGALYLVQAIAGHSGLKPADIVVAYNNYNVYALTAPANTIDGFSREFLGKLKPVSSTTGLPASATGLATY